MNEAASASSVSSRCAKILAACAWACLAARTGAAAGAGDQSYHFVSGDEEIFSGPRADSLASVRRTELAENLAGVTVLHPETEYAMVAGFAGAGACDAWMRTRLDL